MNYCILNGVKSNTVKGLLIQSLPPVSKPLIRTQVEQIDGRDGDIVTPLGYSAYDKQMKIGLYGDFDINDVIQYFDSSGTVTFSNEPDKYYNYQIIQQIDFERLLRFREATVTFHVQPFKYSAIDDPVTGSTDKFSGLPNDTITKNGITVTASGGNIAISGTASAYAEIYLPIFPVNLAAGSYTLALTASGTGATACPTRLIGDVPSNADSFGGTYVSLQENGTATLSATLTAAKTFNYLWFYISPNVAVDITLDVMVIDSSITSISLLNLGNTNARPTIELTGSGIINLMLNGNEVLSLNLDAIETIAIDTEAMNAYYGDVLANRAVTGDYEDVVLAPGTNTLSWSGSVISVQVSNVSRWI